MPPWPSGIPRGVPAEGVVSVVWSAAAHFPSGSLGNHQKGTTLDANYFSPVRSSGSHYSARIGSWPTRADGGVQSQSSVVLRGQAGEVGMSEAG